jgi:peptidoglycan/LPS O-acetylase OafA/YrhL
MSIRYRSDIDGLRAVAVLAVMLFHFGLLGVSGGYVGVDVFFCISGYLIGGIIIEETAASSFSYARFYERRIKRLFPAFFAMALVTVPVAYWLLLPAPDFVQFGQSLMAATAYVPNVFFYRELGGYFGGNASSMPLLHTWSLGVEEQFYIFFPLFMRLALRFSTRAVWALLSGAAMLSLAYAQRRLPWNPDASFYWLQPRAWELLLGALAALPVIRDRRLPLLAGRLLSVAAAAAIAVPLYTYSDSTPFPGIAALPPCLGATWLLWWGRQQSAGVIQWLLRSPPMVWIGRWSYSLYLWHWPVFVFLAYHYSGELSLPMRMCALLLVFGFAALSWRYVEQPIRTGSFPRRRIFLAAAACSLSVLGVGLFIWRNEGLPQRLSGDTQLIAASARDFVQRAGNCYEPTNNFVPGLKHCRLGVGEDNPSFLVWGDSHGRALRDGIDAAAKRVGSNGLLVWGAGCLPAFDYLKHESSTGAEADRECEAQNRAVRAMLEKPGTIRKILLIARWTYYTEGSGIGIDADNRIRIESASASVAPTQAAVVASVMEQSAAWLRDRGYEVYVLEEFPEFPDFSGTRLFQLVRGGQATLQSALARIGTVPLVAVQSRQSQSTTMLRALASTQQVGILPTHAVFCEASLCSVWKSFGQAYFDNNHLTVTASVQFSYVFDPALRP